MNMIDHLGEGLELHHVGLIVENVERSTKRWGQALGIGPFWTSPRIELESAAEVDGERRTIAIAAGMARMGSTLIELIAPLDDTSLFSSFLRDRGEGLHHLAYVVTDLAASTSHLTDVGLTRTAGNTNADPGVVPWVYMEGEAADGAVIELVERGGAFDDFFSQIYDVLD